MSFYRRGLNTAVHTAMFSRLRLKTIVFYAITCPMSIASFSVSCKTYAHEKHHNTTLTGQSSSSLAHLASSRERFAASLNMSVEQVAEAIKARQVASTDLNEQLIAVEENNSEKLTAAEIGRMKHQMICQHRYQFFRNPFVCRKCWTFTPICVCHLFEERKRSQNNDAYKAQLPKGVEKLLIWTHHDEYGRTSNTGSLLPLALEQTDILMKGLPEHDKIINETLHRKDVTPVVLWPDKKSKGESATITDLRRVIKQTTASPGQNHGHKNTDRIILIAIEGTWNTARKMVNKLPPNVIRLDLSEEIRRNFTTPSINEGIFIDTTIKSSTSLNAPSLLAPLRRQGQGAKQDTVSTLEAALVALVALGLTVDDALFILNCAREKVRRIQEYTGKTYPRD